MKIAFMAGAAFAIDIAVLYHFGIWNLLMAFSKSSAEMKSSVMALTVTAAFALYIALEGLEDATRELMDLRNKVETHAVPQKGSRQAQG